MGLKIGFDGKDAGNWIGIFDSLVRSLLDL